MSKELRPLTRYITDHDDSGKAIFSNSLPDEVPSQSLPDHGARFYLCYITQEFPVHMADEHDIKLYKKRLKEPPGLVISTGSVLRVVDMAPGVLSPMHRTVSLDYGVVLEGEVALILDSGEKRVLKRGDVAIQRGTNHAWRNVSETEMARMLYVLQPSAPLTIGGETLGEGLGDMVGVKASE